MKVVLKYLRTLSVKIAAWLDDFILAASSASLVSSHAALTLRTFEELGFVPKDMYTLGTESAHLYQYLSRQKKLIYLGLLHSYTCRYE